MPDHTREAFFQLFCDLRTNTPKDRKWLNKHMRTLKPRTLPGWLVRVTRETALSWKALVSHLCCTGPRQQPHVCHSSQRAAGLHIHPGRGALWIQAAKCRHAAWHAALEQCRSSGLLSIHEANSDKHTRRIACYTRAGATCSTPGARKVTAEAQFVCAGGSFVQPDGRFCPGWCAACSCLLPACKSAALTAACVQLFWLEPGYPCSPSPCWRWPARPDS